MSETKTYVFPESGGNGGGGTNGVLAMLPALMQQRGVDPNILALMGGKNGNGQGWGDGLFAILLLFILMGAFNGNGFGGFGGNHGGASGGGTVPFVQNDANTAVIMQAVQRNGFDIQSLATALNTSSDAVMAAINGLGGQICSLGNQMGQNTNQIVTAIMQGNNSILTQLCNCCCETNNNITKMGYESQLAMCNQTNTLVNTANQNTLQLRDANQANTQAILAKLDAAEMREMQRDLNAKDEKISALTTQLGLEHQNQYTAQVVAQAVAPANAALADLSSRLAKIECAQPPTFPMPYCPASGSYIPVNYSVPVNMGISPLNGCGC